ncbi:MAG: alpha/beta fold hydrolase [Candidatus Eiseniibacteriota bacterium]
MHRPIAPRRVRRSPLRAALVALSLFGILLATTAPSTPPVQLRTIEFGHGPTIVLVPSLGTGRMTWMPTARKLLAGHHVVLVDLPGHGDSPLPDPFSLEAAAEALDQVVARQPFDSTIVVGQGVGGLLALMAASAHPGHQRGLVVVDLTLKSPLPIDDQTKGKFAEFMDQNYDTFLQLVFGHSGRDSVQSVAIHAMAAQVPPNTMKAYFRALISVDATHALHDLKTAILPVFTEHVLASESDWPSVSKQMGWAEVGSFTPHRISGAGTLVASEQPDSLALAISDFSQHVMSAP